MTWKNQLEILDPRGRSYTQDRLESLKSLRRTKANARGKTWSVVAPRLKATAILSWAILIMARSMPSKNTQRSKTHTIHTTRWRSCSRRMYTMRRVVHVPVAPLTLTPQSLLLATAKLLKVTPSLAILTVESSRLFWLRIHSRLWLVLGFWWRFLRSNFWKCVKFVLEVVWLFHPNCFLGCFRWCLNENSISHTLRQVLLTSWIGLLSIFSG
ncbi:hypothetical protein SEVIR_2G397466v4 [Setaria viridis]